MKYSAKSAVIPADWLEDIDEKEDVSLPRNEYLGFLTADEEEEIEAYFRRDHRESLLRDEEL